MVQTPRYKTMSAGLQMCDNRPLPVFPAASFRLGVLSHAHNRQNRPNRFPSPHAGKFAALKTNRIDKKMGLCPSQTRPSFYPQMTRMIAG
jgi:hypothetical protein